MASRGAISRLVVISLHADAVWTMKIICGLVQDLIDS